jgi:hypothetical protein
MYSNAGGTFAGEGFDSPNNDSIITVAGQTIDNVPLQYWIDTVKGK